MSSASADRTARMEPVLVGIVLFAIYAWGASPTIFVGDSGELVAASATLGIAHPSGYPLYILLGKLWTLIVPFGSVAYRMSLFSAAAAAAAVAGVYFVARRELGLDRHAALLACGLLAFGPSFWGEANIQRVYALNALFVALATAAAIAWTRAPSPRKLVLVFFLCGLGASNHTFMALFAIGFAVYAYASDSARYLRPWLWVPEGLAAAVAFGVGLLPYAYLPIRSRMQPRLDWGNPETLQSFLDVVLRRDFWQRAWIESPFDLVTITNDYGASLLRETAWVGAILLVIGVVAGRRRRAPVGLLVLLMLVNLAAVALHGSRSDIFIWHRYYIPSYLMAALLAGLGWQAIAARIPPPARWIALALPALLFVTGWRDFDRSRYRVAEDFGYAVLESLPPGAHLVATDDNVLFVLIYLQLVEGRRPDIDLILRGVGDADLPPLHFDPDDEPLFFTHHPNWNLPELEIVPLGVVYRAQRRGRPIPEVVLPRAALAGEHDERVPKDYLTENLIGHFHYTMGFTFENRDWLRARDEFAKAAAASPSNDVLFYNLGLVFARNGLYPEAERAFARSHEINPRRIASMRKADATEKVAAVQDEIARIASIEDGLRASHPDLASAPAERFDERMAQLLDAAGEPTAARGHRLRALEARGS